MSVNNPRLFINGASSQLGRLVAEHVRRLSPDADITAMVRTPQAADELAPFRVTTRITDYTDPASFGYRNMSEAEYRAALLGMSLPDAMATMLADTEKGALDDHGRVLSRLISHPTTPLADAVAAVVQGG